MSGAFEIEKGVPIPGKRNGRSVSPEVIALLAMSPGDSIFLAGRDRHSGGSVRHRAILQSGNKFDYTLRTVEGGVRIWRLL